MEKYLTRQQIVRAKRFLKGILSLALEVVPYIVWIEFMRLVFLSILTYLLSGKKTGFQEINDIASATQLPVLAVSALIYATIRRFRSKDTNQEFFKALRGGLTPFLKGMLRAITLSLIFLYISTLTGHSKFFGTYFEVDDFVWLLIGTAIRIFSVITLVLIEEYLFRFIFFQKARELLNVKAAIAVTTLFYVVAKGAQFSIGPNQVLTLMLFSLFLCLWVIEKESFVRGAGYLAGWILVVHILFSLPIMGIEQNGVWIIKAITPISSVADAGSLDFFTQSWFSLESMNNLIFRLVTGGPGGPFSSITVQAILAAELIFIGLRIRKLLFSN